LQPRNPVFETKLSYISDIPVHAVPTRNIFSALIPKLKVFYFFLEAIGKKKGGSTQENGGKKYIGPANMNPQGQDLYFFIQEKKISYSTIYVLKKRRDDSHLRLLR
jgi:hypothetical protein